MIAGRTQGTISMFDRILVPLDGSSRAERVLVHVGKILRRRDVEVLLLSVVSPARLKGRVHQHISSVERSRAESHLREVAARLQGEGVRARWLLAEGTPAEAILEAAIRESCTLVAIATHGRSGVARWILGSVAERIVRASGVPVLLVRSFREGAELPAEHELGVRTILVPTDGSRASEAAFSPAIECARFFDAEVVVLQVRGDPTLAAAWAVPYGQFPVPPDVAEDWARRFRAGGIRARAEFSSGDAASRIVDRAKELGVDLIAMATHGYSGVSRWFMGSVTERVLRAAEMPLLVVRSPGEETREEAAVQKPRRARPEPRPAPSDQPRRIINTEPRRRQRTRK